VFGSAGIQIFVIRKSPPDHVSLRGHVQAQDLFTMGNIRAHYVLEDDELVKDYSQRLVAAQSLTGSSHKQPFESASEDEGCRSAKPGAHSGPHVEAVIRDDNQADGDQSTCMSCSVDRDALSQGSTWLWSPHRWGRILAS
jgi:hypothetical protein